MRLVIALPVSIGGAFIGMNLVQEPWQIWIIGAITGLLVDSIMRFGEGAEK